MSKKLGELWKEASGEEKDKYKVCYAYAHTPIVPEAWHQKPNRRAWLMHQSINS